MTPRLLIAALATTAMLSGCSLLPKDESAGLAPVSCGTRDINVYFDGSSIELTPEARLAINTVAEGLKGCTIKHVRVIGSSGEAAEDGSEELSKQRAQVISAYVVDTLGWSRDNMELLATGERSATTASGLNVPMRRTARIIVEAAAP